MDVFCPKCGYVGSQFILAQSAPNPYRQLCEYHGYFHVINPQPIKHEYKTVWDCRCPKCDYVLARYIGQFDPSQTDKEALYRRLLRSYWRNKRLWESRKVIEV